MIEILNRQKRFKIDIDRLRRLLERLIDIYENSDPEVTVALVNDRPMQDLNRRFLRKDATTDVLSFPIRDSGPDGRYYLGDILICVPYAARQSKDSGHGLQLEVELLAIHGFLHLQGFEHFKGLEKEEKRIRGLWLKESDEL
jgi:probable rRNA maturation factor